MARVLLTDRGQVVREFLITTEATRIGRERLNQIQVKNPTVSRFHAEIHRRGYCYSIEDKQSTNGTTLNGSVLTGERSLNDKDVIALGEARLVFVMDPGDLPAKFGQENLETSETAVLLGDQA